LAQCRLEEVLHHKDDAWHLFIPTHPH
jgi:hypothetical protein